MKATGGKANPALLNERLKAKLAGQASSSLEIFSGVSGRSPRHTGLSKGIPSEGGSELLANIDRYKNLVIIKHV